MKTNFYESPSTMVVEIITGAMLCTSGSNCELPQGTPTISIWNNDTDIIEGF